MCPYYLSREQQHASHITLTPYNYLVDPGVRRSLAIDLDGAVLIFDEAHNLVRAHSSPSPPNHNNYNTYNTHSLLE